MSASPARAHSTGVRRAPVPRGPRRISGPSSARTPAAREQARVARSARALNPGSAGGAVALPRPGGASAPAFVPRAVDALRRLPDNRWLDRLLRGQAWIVVIGIALMGIVAMQVSLLKMNAGIGRAVEHSQTLERQNADLRAAVSTLSSEARIQREAAAMGMIEPPAGDVRYVTARGAEDARRAAEVMRSPSPPQPVSQLTQAQAGVPGAAVADPAAASGVTPATGAPAAAPTAPTATEPVAATTPEPAAAQATPPAQPTTQAAPTGAAVAPAGG